MNAEVTIDLGCLDFGRPKVGEFTDDHLVLFRKSPWAYRKRHLGLTLPRRCDALCPEALSGPAKSRVLEGRDVYERHYSSLATEQLNYVEMVASGVAMNDEAVELLLYGRALCTIHGSLDDASGIGCASTVDWVHPHRGIVSLVLVDDIRWAESEIRRKMMVSRAAYQRALFVAAEQEAAPAYIIACEIQEPFTCGVWRIGEAALNIADVENRAMLRELRQCLNADYWPARYESIRQIDMPY